MLEALAALAKFALCAGSLSGAGAAFAWASLGPRLGAAGTIAPLIVTAGACFTLLASLATVLILVLRLGGDFSPPTLSAVFEGPPGLAAGLQLAGAAMLLVFSRGSGPAWIGRVASGGLVVASFAVNGHAAAVDLISGIVAFVHVLAAAWWFGALLLLWPACRQLAASGLEQLVRTFSRIAMAVVTNLVLAGVLLILILVDFSHAPWPSPYGQTLAVKVGLAGLVLGLALFNKLRLTPRLAHDDDGVAATTLRRSIAVELTLFLAVIAATSILTTYTSPHT
jgi:putative copper export protein